MDCKHIGENGRRAKSFRDEDYNNRRVFLRSYPLHWGEEVGHEENKEEVDMVTTESNWKKPRKIILSLFHWGEGKVVVLKRFKHKIAIYVIACMPARLKPPAALISA